MDVCWSRYNYLLKREGVYMLYNSLSNSFAELDKETYELLSLCEIGSPMPSNVSSGIKNDLLRMKAFVQSDETERLKIKYNTQRMRFIQSKLSLTICPTSACNFRCQYCFEHEHPNVSMDDDVEDDIIAFIKAHTDAKAIDVTWFGGEPLLQFERIKSITRKILKLDLPYRAAIVTNGYLLTEKILRQLKDVYIHSMQITIDGLKNSHDSRRYLKNGGPTYDRIIFNIATASKLIPEIAISVRVNIDQNNADEYIYFYNFLKEQKWNNVSTYPAFVGDYSEGNCGYMLDAPTRRNILEKYSDATGENFRHFYPSGIRSECAIRNMNAYVIGPKGEIYKCWNDVGKPERVVADINGKVTNEALLLDYLTGADPLEDPKCLECILLPICGGGCPYERLRKSHEQDTCPLLKNNLNDFLWRKYLKQKSCAANK